MGMGLGNEPYHAPHSLVGESEFPMISADSRVIAGANCAKLSALGRNKQRNEIRNA